MELIVESVLSRGPLWKNFVEHDSSGEIIPGQTRKPLCQQLVISLGAPGAKLEYMSTNPGCVPPLTLAVCHPGWDDYLDLNEILAKMTHHLMEEDRQWVEMVPKGGAIPKKKDVTKIVALPPNDDTTFVPASEFPATQYGDGTPENPVNLSDAPTEAWNTGTCPQGADPDDESKILDHSSDALGEMAECIMDLEDGYFKALHEVIIEMEKALWDISCIDSHYVSCIVTVMATWQEATQAAVSHMENIDVTIYLACQEDARRVTKEYLAEVKKACKEHDATHFKEKEAWKKAIKADDHEDLVIYLLNAKCKAKGLWMPFLTRYKKLSRSMCPSVPRGL